MGAVEATRDAAALRRLVFSGRSGLPCGLVDRRSRCLASAAFPSATGATPPPTRIPGSGCYGPRAAHRGNRRCVRKLRSTTGLRHRRFGLPGSVSCTFDPWWSETVPTKEPVDGRYVQTIRAAHGSQLSMLRSLYVHKPAQPLRASKIYVPLAGVSSTD